MVKDVDEEVVGDDVREFVALDEAVVMVEMIVEEFGDIISGEIDEDITNEDELLLDVRFTRGDKLGLGLGLGLELEFEFELELIIELELDSNVGVTDTELLEVVGASALDVVALYGLVVSWRLLI